MDEREVAQDLVRMASELVNYEGSADVQAALGEIENQLWQARRAFLKIGHTTHDKQWIAKAIAAMNSLAATVVDARNALNRMSRQMV